MRKLLFWTIFLLSAHLFASPGDTLIVQTFIFDSIATRRGVFAFPENTEDYAKIIMVYTLKCDPRTPHDKFDCGEWDYCTYTRIYSPNLLKPTDTTYKEPFIELARFITPYGIRLDLGPNGFSWIYDVSDYAPLLRAKVDLSAGNGQELLDLKFLFIKGTPPRRVLSVKDLWFYSSDIYKDLADNKVKSALLVSPSNEASTYRLKTRISGHGHFGPENCCEWVAKNHYWIINNDTIDKWKIWRDCGMNPVYPQGGTWQFDRAGWCPGTFVATHDLELTPFLENKKPFLLDYAIQPYDTANGESGGNYEIAIQLVEYGEPSFKRDAAVSDIIAPSIKDEYKRDNPISLNPIIEIENLGSDTLKTATIYYGLVNGSVSEYHWEGSLPFMGKCRVSLPIPDWGVLSPDPARPEASLKKGSKFFAEIKQPNQRKDKNRINNRLESIVSSPAILPQSFIMEVKTNSFGRAADNSASVFDENKNIVFSYPQFVDDSTYRIQINLKPGAYRFLFSDKNEDGLIKHWWLRNEDPNKVGNNGSLKLLNLDGSLLFDFGYDWAQEASLEFFTPDPNIPNLQDQE